MSKPLRRAVEPMPRTSDQIAHYRVRDQTGRIIRGGDLEPGSDLWARLRAAHDVFARQGYSVGALKNGHWAFPAVKGQQRLMVAIQIGIASLSPRARWQRFSRATDDRSDQPLREAR